MPLLPRREPAQNRPHSATMVRVIGKVLSLLLLPPSFAACRQPPMSVNVAFTTSWKLGTESVNNAERSLIKREALATLRRAFSGFDVHFVEGESGVWRITVEDTPFVSDPRQRVSFGAAGATYPASRLSSVRLDVLWNAELAAV